MRYSRIAGERALASYAPEEALAHFQRAIAAKQDQALPKSSGQASSAGSGQASSTGSEPALSSPKGQAVDGEYADLLFGLGRAQVSIFPARRGAEIVPNLRRAFNYYTETGDWAKAVAVAVSHTVTRPGPVYAATELIPRALGLVPPDSREAGVLLSRYIMFLGIGQGDYEGAEEAKRRAPGNRPTIQWDISEERGT